MASLAFMGLPNKKRLVLLISLSIMDPLVTIDLGMEAPRDQRPFVDPLSVQQALLSFDLQYK